MYNGTVTMLAKQISNGIAAGTYWNSVDVAYGGSLGAIRDLGNHREIVMTQNGSSTGTLLESSTPVSNQNEGTLNAWVNCGVQGY